ncbi:dihydrofolate synthase / folylpolyglutamate synthase [Seinonella peptonophila]|uniref:tetrahydrofolate synthase n=1 Tax=Seinonella peptonophila TaxID=112248 RepID=A0A1M4TUA7_9BACL|nr:dihydrofolate synthase / folylpolyglutamate synthase [Seinonella peptonophila]
MGKEGTRLKEDRPFFYSANELFQQLRPEHEMKLGLERVEWLLERIGNPQRRLRIIHIAGTNGKGSTSMMISSVLREANYSVGVFLSPPILAWNERIQVDGKFISEASFLRWVNKLWPFIEEMKEKGIESPSFYELWTVVALCYFAKEAVPDYVVLETGLGGRFDATNVVFPLISVITQIGLDHREQLGDTVEQIAFEKAGIIKAGVPVVCGFSSDQAQAVIQQIAKERNAPYYQGNQHFHVSKLIENEERQEFKVETLFRTYSRLAIQLRGQHQIENAGVALMALEILQQRYAVMLAEEQIEMGMLQAFIPGRLEQIGRRPFLLLDGAHNEDSMRKSLETITRLYTYRKCIVVTAMMRDKDVESMLSMLGEVTDFLITTTVDRQPRSVPADQLAEQALLTSPSITIEANSSVEKALKQAKNIATEDDLILVIGSLYLVAEARLLLVHQ